MIRKILQILTLLLFLCNNTKAKGYGSGFLISNDGYLVTNYHVIKGALDIAVRGINGDMTKYYEAKVIATDKENDLAILKIDCKLFPKIPYTVRWEVAKVGEEVFALGYPEIGVLGSEIKYTKGDINSLSGYQGKISEYQISAAIHHGSSGGALFDNNGEIIGITSGGVPSLENVGYAVKIPLLNILIQSSKKEISLPKNNLLKNKSREQQIELAQNFIVFVETGVYSEAKKIIELKEEKIRRERIEEEERILQEKRRQEEAKEKERLFRIETNFLKKLNDAESVFNSAHGKNNISLYEQAEKLYHQALEIKPDDSRATGKLKLISDIKTFLKERPYETYSYQDLESSEYHQLKRDLENSVSQEVKANDLYGKAKLEIVYTVDTTGSTTVAYQNELGNNQLIGIIKTIAEGKELKQAKKFEYTVNAHANYTIEVESIRKLVSVKKGFKQTDIHNKCTIEEKTRIQNTMKNGPVGKYEISLNQLTVNGYSSKNDMVTRYKNTAGPLNAFKSVLVPGLGQYGVGGSAKAARSAMVYTYGLIGASIYYKIAADENYKLYHEATTQADMDKYYEKANKNNQVFYGLAAAGAVLWLGDIISVTAKGFKNLKEGNQYKHTLSFSPMVSPNGTDWALSYKITF